MRLPWISTGWTKAGLLKPTARVDRAKVLAPPLSPKADVVAAKMVRRVRAVIFMVFLFVISRQLKMTTGIRLKKSCADANSNSNYYYSDWCGSDGDSNQYRLDSVNEKISRVTNRKWIYDRYLCS